MKLIPDSKMAKEAADRIINGERMFVRIIVDSGKIQYKHTSKYIDNINKEKRNIFDY